MPMKRMLGLFQSEKQQMIFRRLKIVTFWDHLSCYYFFRHLLLSVEQEDVATLYLPQLSKNHLLLVLDYVYKGRMYIKANQLQHVLSVIEVLSLECGVSVTKKVRKEPKDPWVEGGVFTSFTDKGVLQVRRYVFSIEFPQFLQSYFEYIIPSRYQKFD